MSSSLNWTSCPERLLHTFRHILTRTFSSLWPRGMSPRNPRTLLPSSIFSLATLSSTFVVIPSSFSRKLSRTASSRSFAASRASSLALTGIAREVGVAARNISRSGILAPLATALIKDPRDAVGGNPASSIERAS